MIEAADIRSNIDQVEQNISKLKIQGRKLQEIIDHDKEQVIVLRLVER